MRIVSWNVNGIKTIRRYHPWINHTFDQIANSSELNADILCIQEVKSTKVSLQPDMIQIPGYDCFYSLPATKSGYSGVATFVKQSIGVVTAEEGIASMLNSEIGGLNTIRLNFNHKKLKELDSEGRCMITDHKLFVLFNLYCPNGDSSAERNQFKIDFCQVLQCRIEELIKMGRNVIVVGDINICYKAIDHFEYENNKDMFEDTPSRNWLINFVHPKGPLMDVFREKHPEKLGQYTVWNTKLNARPSNCGTRIDYTFVNYGFHGWIKDSFIMQQIMGSDHCPGLILIFNL
jgi:AP endonuclease-2